MLKFVSSGILSGPYINIFKNFALQTQGVMQSDHLSVLVFGRQMLGRKKYSVSHLLYYGCKSHKTYC